MSTSTLCTDAHPKINNLRVWAYSSSVLHSPLGLFTGGRITTHYLCNRCVARTTFGFADVIFFKVAPKGCSLSAVPLSRFGILWIFTHKNHSLHSCRISSSLPSILWVTRVLKRPLSILYFMLWLSRCKMRCRWGVYPSVHISFSIV